MRELFTSESVSAAVSFLLPPMFCRLYLYLHQHYWREKGEGVVGEVFPTATASAVGSAA